jgi:antitoxin HigA-1
MAKQRKIEPVHPGEVLAEEFMKPLKLTANKLALELRVPSNRITGIINKERTVSAETALRLARYFGTSAGFWVNL